MAAAKAAKRARPADASEGHGVQPMAQKTRRQDHAEPAGTERESLTIDELIRSRAREPKTKDLAILSYPSTGTDYIDYTPADLNAMAKRAVAHYSSRLIPRRRTSDDPVQVVGLLGPSSIDYFITLLGISRLGHTVLFLSTRISEEAHVSLLRDTKASVLLVDSAFQSMGEKVKQHLPDLIVGRIAGLDEFKITEALPHAVTQLDSVRETKNVAWILHSSGSTSLPRPNFVTHAAALGNYRSQLHLIGFCTLPLYHMYGLSCVFRSITNRKKIYLYSAALPLTTQHLIQTLGDHEDIRVFYSVPYALKLLAESDEGTRLLARLEVVMFGGSACPKPIGDKLAQRGVMVVSHHASSETGQLMSSMRPRPDILEWDWLRPSETVMPFLRMEPQDAECKIFELVVLPGWPSKVATNRDDGSYATKDLFERHPESPYKNAWRYYARKDDTIVLVNGEKANPMLLEGAARYSSLVSEAIVFGAGMAHLGMFILPSEPSLSREEIVRAIWPSIEVANIAMPAHAKLSKDMVCILPPEASKEVRITDKGNLIRAAFYKQFADLIDAAYDEVRPKEELLTLDEGALRTWLRRQIQAIVSPEQCKEVKDDTDLFSFGVDSLQASQLRAVILRSIDIGASGLPQNVVFDHPSIAELAKELVRLRTGGACEEERSIEERMQAMIDRYSTFDQPHPQESSVPGEYVLLTGVTGSLGAYVLAQLTSLDTVKMVFCLIRARTDEDAMQRLQQSLCERKVTADFEKVLAYASDLNDPTLGLPSTAFDAIVGNLSRIIHCAWKVDFNLGLQSFEHDCVKGTKHLIDLCLKAPRHTAFNFCSSISAVGRSPCAWVPEELSSTLSVAQDMGYAQSKLVTEHICMNAAKATGMTVRVIRVGQIVGDTQHGIWNAQEAIPMMLQSAKTIGALPALNENLSWLPVNTVAAALIDVSLPSTSAGSVFHLVNHCTFNWSRDLLPMLKQAGLDFETVERREWLKRLRQHPNIAANPPYKLMDFFGKKYGADEVKPSVTYTSSRARSASSALAEAAVVDSTLVGLYVRYLKGVWAVQSEQH